MPRQEFSSLRQGLVGAWCPSLGASGRLLIDRSGVNNHATFTGTSYSFGRDLSVTGTTLATARYVPQLDFERTSAFTLSGFVSFASSATMILVGNSPNAGVSGFEIQYVGGQVRLLLSSNFPTNTIRVNTSSAVPVATVFHLATTYDGTGAGSGVNIFVNGSAVPKTIALDTLTGSTVTGSPLLLFRRSDATLPFLGTLDDFRAYNRVLTLAEIRLLASRRGIGLTPLPDRAAGLPRKLSVNVGGTWRAADAYVNVGGVWRLGQASVNVSGVWK
jgi:hypothetical protein